MSARILPSPNQLVDYVDRTGWRRVGSTRFTALYEIQDSQGSLRQIMLPLNERLKDYRSALNNVLQSLAEIEGRDRFSIAHALGTSGIDRVDVLAESDEPGSTSLPDASSLFAGARGMLLASASSVIRPSASFSDSHPGDAEKYVDAIAARVVPGSFVVRLDCPISLPAEDSQLELRIDYGRQVTTTLVGGIEAAVTVAQYDGEHARAGAWRETIADGVSADLVDALVKIAPRSTESGSREVSVDFSRAFPTNNAQRASVEVPPGIRRSLQHGADELRNLVEPVSANLVGQALGIERERSGRGAIVVKILGVLTVDGAQPRRATVRVTAPDLDEALLIDAYRSRESVRFVGEVVRRGKRYVMPVVTFAGIDGPSGSSGVGGNQFAFDLEVGDVSGPDR